MIRSGSYFHVSLILQIGQRKTPETIDAFEKTGNDETGKAEGDPNQDTRHCQIQKIDSTTLFHVYSNIILT